MDEHNHQSYPPGEEDYYSRRDKIPPPRRLSGQRLLPIFIIVIVILLIVVIGLGTVTLRLLTASPQNAPQTSTPVAATAATVPLQGTSILTAVTPIPTPSPTPIPLTPTPTPPPQCTDQNGAPPNGPVATEFMTTCLLPSGFVAVIAVCNEAHLVQPAAVQPYNEVQGAGIISYQNPAGVMILSLEAQNSALANASCPAKFRVVPVSQVDEHVAQETLRLKNLIGNNANVTYVKVIGEESTKTIS